jgi:hypothetical protein
MGDWKLLEFFEDGSLELYNTKNDLSETTNLAEQMPAKVKEMHDVMLKWRKMVKAPVPSVLNPQYDGVAANLKPKIKGKKK